MSYTGGSARIRLFIDEDSRVCHDGAGTGEIGAVFSVENLGVHTFP
jgi:hypothetical protein